MQLSRHQLSLGLEQRYIYQKTYSYLLHAWRPLLYMYTIAGLFHLLCTDITTGVMLNY